MNNKIRFKYHILILYKSHYVSLADSSRQQLISTGLGDPLVYQKIAIVEPQAYIDVLPSGSVDGQIDYLDDPSDDEEYTNLYGFSKTDDEKIMRSINRIMNLTTFRRCLIRGENHWNPTRSITPYRKRNHPGLVKSVYNTFSSDKGVNATPEVVPKRRRCQKLNH